MKLPVLLVFFNRRNTLESVLECIRRYKPHKLFLSSDGPRPSVKGESLLVDDIRSYVLASIDWDCSVECHFHDSNLGCKVAVNEAIQWFFSKEERGIILEDDIVPSDYFFTFCENALDIYKDNKEIGSIGGRCEVGVGSSPNSNDTFFSSKFFCWGWASWSDRILGLDTNISSNSDVKKDMLNSLVYPENLMVKGMYGLVESKQVNSWAYEYDLNFRFKGQLQLLPSHNMVTNIGFQTEGAHSSASSFDRVVRYDDFLPVCRHVSIAYPSSEFIADYAKYVYKSTFRLYLFSLIKYLKFIRKLFK